MVISWGRAHHYDNEVETPAYLHEARIFSNSKGCSTIHGQGRSYGDVALNDDGRIVKTSALNRIQAIDWNTGLLRAESGATLDQILQFIVPHGWFLPVTPGSKFVSLGGAVANDVHGKNHHHAGSFGGHVTQLGLRRSDGEALTLSLEQNSDLFELTISGLGLTGFIEWVELQLTPIRSVEMDVENIPYASLDEFFELSYDSINWPYAVAWVDCFASGSSLGRGIFTRAMHSQEPGKLINHGGRIAVNWPVETPGFILNRTTISMFNCVYRSFPGANRVSRSHYAPFFYPLDGIGGWNKLYGRRGFYQHQSIIPKENAISAVRELLNTISASGQGSFLAVMKNHGRELSPGRNSFCLEGTSLALDFANRGEKTLQLLRFLDDVVIKNGGRMYPAKDGTMSAQAFQTGFQNWAELEAARDPALNSAFWQRVTKEK